MALTKCRECSKEVSTQAKRCPHCGASVKKSNAGWIGFLILILFIIVIALITGQSDSNSAKNTINEYAIKAGPELEKSIQQLLIDGSIHSMNIQKNEVRINPITWSFLSLEQKREIVTNFHLYFVYKQAGDNVNVLSDQNDKKLATYSWSEGINIIE